MEIINKNLELIESSCWDICNTTGVKSIPLNTLEIIIDKSRPSPTGDEKADLFIEKYNSTLDILFLSCQNVAIQSDLEVCPMVILEFYIKTIKDNI